MFRLSFYPIGDSYWLVLAAFAALLTVLALVPVGSKTPRRRRMALMGLRLAVLLLLLLAMLRPTLVYTQTKKQPASLVLLADQSRSMSVPDAVGGRTRYDILRQSLEEARPALAAVAKDFELKAYTFDAEARPVDASQGTVQLMPAPEGRQTAIGAVLEDVLRAEAGKRLLGVLLLSDGAQRAYAPRDVPPQTAASRLKHLGYRLYTFAFGQSRGLGQARDVAVKDLLVNEQVFVNNELEIVGQVRIDGYLNREIPVQLLFETEPGKMEVVAQKTVQANEDGQLREVRFTYVPQTAGEFKLSLEAVGQPGELVTTNNLSSTFVNVLKGGLKVLYLEGNPRVEQKFLRRSLDSSPDVNVNYLRLNARQPESHPSDLIEQFKPGAYDVYILGDLDSSAFRPGELDQLAKTVSQGAGLIMLGGFHSFGPGGYGDGPLANVLPVGMDRLERQRLDDQTRADLHLPGPLKMMPTAQGDRHFVLNLAGKQTDNQSAWEKLPPLEGANRFVQLAPAAEVLAVAGKQPMLVAHQFGLGRVMAFAGDSTWHWWMQGFQSAHKRFWRQVVLWLARKDQSTEGEVWVRLQHRRLPIEQRLEFSVGVQSPIGESRTDFTAEAEVVLPDQSRRRVPLTRQGESLIGSFRDTGTAGDYRVEVTAKDKEETLGAARARFLTFAQDLELDNPAADGAMLESLATTTGGQALAPEQLGDLVRKLVENTEHLEIRQETKRTFWDTWPFFLAFVGLLSVEWWLRKRWGLV